MSAFIPSCALAPNSSLQSCNSSFLAFRHGTSALVPPPSLLPNHRFKITSSIQNQPKPSSTALNATATAPTTTYASTISSEPKVYDYVVVGGGAAGCVLANRLTENTGATVALLEAGNPEDSLLLSIPLGFPYLPGSKYDWSYFSEPQKNLNNRRIFFPRGKLVGGSHAISVMLYHRGDPMDYQKWAQVYGAEGWSPEDVLPYFKKSENQQHGASMFHGSKGPLSVSDLRDLNPISKAFIEACQAAGLEKNDDFNDWSKPQDGVGAFQVTQKDGLRATPKTSYLDPVRGRKNLSVSSGVLVEKIIIEDGVAKGVVLIRPDGRREQILASKEVILSGGVFATPQLLMLSGIGPADHLKEMGIPVVADLPGVGKNFQDHAACMLSFHSPDPYEDKKKTNVYYTEKTGKNILNLLNYFFNGKGPLTSVMCEAGGFVKTNPSFDSCDVQLRFIPFFSEPDPYHSLGDFAAGGENYLSNKSNRPAGVTLQTVVVRPRSKGQIRLRSLDVRDKPLIDANWLDEDDMKSMVEGIKLCRKIAAQSPLKEYCGNEIYPGPNVNDDKAIEEYVKQSCHTANAIVGSCRMGTGADAVVGPDLKVRNVKNLRIVDSSVMPTLPGGQAGAPTMMIAEKGADIIKRDHA